MATQIAIEEPLAPGFRILPGGNVAYSVAEDYPKQMANIAAEFEARAAAPRYNPFGPAPDSPEALYREIIAPWYASAMKGAMPQQPKVSTVKSGSDIYQLTQRPNGQIDATKIITGEKPQPKEPTMRGPVGFTPTLEPIMSGNWTQRQWLESSNAIPASIRTNLPVSNYLNPNWWQANATTTNAPMAAPATAPQITIGAAPDVRGAAVETKRGRKYEVIQLGR